VLGTTEQVHSFQSCPSSRLPQYCLERPIDRLDYPRSWGLQGEWSDLHEAKEVPRINLWHPSQSPHCGGVVPGARRSGVPLRVAKATDWLPTWWGPQWGKTNGFFDESLPELVEPFAAVDLLFWRLVGPTWRAEWIMERRLRGKIWGESTDVAGRVN